MTLHRCIRVCSLAALLLIVPAGVFARANVAHEIGTAVTGPGWTWTFTPTAVR